MIRILVTGSRVFQYDINNLSKIVELTDAIADYLGPEGWDEEIGMPTAHTTIVVGDCPTGMDLIAREWSLNNWVAFEEFEADWNAHGRLGGPVRNQAMVDTRPDVCLAFPLVLHSWSGTMDCMTRASVAGIPVIVDGEPWTPEPWMIERLADV